MHTLSLETAFENDADPLDLVETVVESHDWPFDRSDGELIVSVSGNWCDYHLCFSRSSGDSVIHMTCAPDLRVPQARYRDIYHLIGLMNERLAVGHFDLWSADGVPLFRFSQLMPESAASALNLAENLIEIALTESERFYPAIQFLLWGGRDPEEAIEAALLTPVGTA